MQECEQRVAVVADVCDDLVGGVSVVIVVGFGKLRVVFVRSIHIGHLPSSKWAPRANMPHRDSVCRRGLSACGLLVGLASMSYSIIGSGR